MPLSEGYLPHRGDELLIRVRALHDARIDETDSMVHVEVVGNEHRKLFVDLDNIHSIYCRKWNEGDKVASLEFEGHGTVIATNDSDVWIKSARNGLMWSLSANELEPYVEPTTDMVELGEEVAFNYPSEPPVSTGSQATVGDDEEIKF